MEIKIKTTSDGVIKCRTEIDGRLYKSKYRDCNLSEARKRFRRKVIEAEKRLMEQMRQEIIDTCLNCQKPVKQCDGRCKVKQTIKIKRGKRVV